MIVPIESSDRIVADKVIKEARFQLKAGDRLFLVSDGGVIYAGVGGGPQPRLGGRGPMLQTTSRNQRSGEQSISACKVACERV